MGQPYAQFGNIKWTAGWSLDYQGGREASVCTIRTVPHLDHIEPYGQLTIGEEGSGELVLRDCLLLKPTFNQDRTWELPILDRRWKWAYGVCDGVYNIKRPDKTYIRERTPQQLAELLLVGMGEKKNNWDIGRLPNFARPEVDWTNQNPASMFDDLVTSLGCVWTLDYFRDCVVVWPVGQGVNLPDAPTISRQYGLSAKAAPDSIRVRGSRSMFQMRFATEAVGKDTDGKIKKLSDVTGYVVADHDDPEDWSDVEGTYEDNGETKDKKDLAKEWAYRAYRITGIAGDQSGYWKIPALEGGEHAPQSFWDFEFLDSRAEQEVDETDIGPDGVATGRKVNKPPLVMARWYDSENAETPAVGELKRYTGHVTFEPKLGLVRFSDPVYLNDDTKTPNHQPATVYIDVAFYAGRDGVFARPFIDVPTGSNTGTGQRLVVREDIEDRVIYHFEKTSIKSTEFIPNDVFAQLQYYADATLREYAEIEPSLTRTYHGLLPIVPDGRIRQITWAGGDGKGPTTQVSVNTEHNPYVPTVQESRRQQTIEELLKVPPWQRTPADRKLLTAQFG